MKPYYETKLGKLYHGDCLEIMPELEQVDLVLTDPPYGVRKDSWDNMNTHQFAKLSMSWLSAVKSKEIISFCSSYHNSEIIPSLIKLIMPNTRNYIWHKPLGSQYAGSAENGLWFSYELICHGHMRQSACKPKTLEIATIIKRGREKIGLSRGGVDMLTRGKKTGLCYRWEEAACLPSIEQALILQKELFLDSDFIKKLKLAYRNKADSKKAKATDVFLYPPSFKTKHPCEKPIPLMTDLLKICDAKSIIDPFLGSGSTAIACEKLNRKWIGIEISEKYCEIAAKRIEAEASQLKLFR